MYCAFLAKSENQLTLVAEVDLAGDPMKKGAAQARECQTVTKHFLGCGCL